MMRNCRKLACLGVLAMLVACGDSANEILGGELASIDLSNEGRVEFHEPMPGELVLIYTGKEDTYREMFDKLERGAVTHAELYEAMSGEAAPPALVEAAGRALAARAQAEADPSTDSEITSVFEPLRDAGSSKNGTGTPSLTEDEFMRSYCPSGWSYLYCWTSRTGNGEVIRLSWSMYTYVNAYRGSVLHELSYWRDGAWVTYVIHTAPQDYVMYIHHWGVRMWRRMSISQAEGDGWHGSIFGTD